MLEVVGQQLGGGHEFCISVNPDPRSLFFIYLSICRPGEEVHYLRYLPNQVTPSSYIVRIGKKKT